ncbi:MAG: DNA primase [Gemmataceae bacterium]
MPPVSVELKKQVKAANDIVDVIGSYLPVQTAGKLFKALCPFHNDTRPSLQIDRQYQNFRCWACDSKGDVFDFVMRFEKVDFPESLRILAERAGIKLNPDAHDPQAEARGRLLRVMRWAEERYTGCLRDDPAAVSARTYLGERRLAGKTVQQFGLGYAPLPGDWLVKLGEADGVPTDLMVEVGLIAPRDENRGFYDRFRDRVTFPIRDIRGQTVGFGGRILPNSLLPSKAKYLNSAETPLFKKSELIYGLDLARHPGSAAGYLAVVEGYTDVMMAHQCGVANVVATMGTALTREHVAQLRRYAPKVVLVFDADAGGQTGVDRALELFVSQDAELAVATLPEGLDPCDLLVQPGGIEVFRTALNSAVDALEFKLNYLLARESTGSVEGTRRVVDAILGVMALAPPVPSQSGQVRQELIVTRLAHRLGLRQETVWARLAELKSERRRKDQSPPTKPAQPATNQGAAEFNAAVRGQPAARAKADPVYFLELTLMRLLVADPGLMAEVARDLTPEDFRTPTIRRVIGEMFALWQTGQIPDLDALRVRLLDDPPLFSKLMDQADIGRKITDRAEQVKRVIGDFARFKAESDEKPLKDKLKSGTFAEEEATDLLRKLQDMAKKPSAN